MAALLIGHEPIVVNLQPQYSAHTNATVAMTTLHVASHTGVVTFQGPMYTLFKTIKLFFFSP